MDHQVNVIHVLLELIVPLEQTVVQSVPLVHIVHQPDQVVVQNVPLVHIVPLEQIVAQSALLEHIVMLVQVSVLLVHQDIRVLLEQQGKVNAM